jgi:threonine/homoserine/homoserine lactone efflux protein
MPPVSQWHQEGSVNATAAVYLLVLVAAITPGPNNLMVLRAAMHRGVAGAIGAIAGCVLGGLLVLGAAAWGARELLAVWPGALRALTVVGALYLAGLGLALVLRPGAGAASGAGPVRGAVATSVAMLGFQLVNPKCWIMAITAIGTQRGSVAALGVAFTAIPVLCLTAWAGFGALLARQSAHPVRGRWIDRVLGLLLFGCALALVGAS